MSLSIHSCLRISLIVIVCLNNILCKCIILFIVQLWITYNVYFLNLLFIDLINISF